MTARGTTSRDRAAQRALEQAAEPAAGEPAAEQLALPVGEVSRLAGVTIRTLHHYDDIGLVRASVRTGAGYRLYTPDDLGRLHAALAYREGGPPAAHQPVFYDCSHEMHVGLADMYVADPRFTSHYETVAAGLAQYVHDTIHANALRAAG